MDIGISVQFVLVFSLVVTRLVGFFMFAPIFSAATVPSRVRAALIVVFAFISVNLVPPQSISSDPLVVSGLMVKEFLVGLALAFTVGIVFIGAQMAGSLLDNITGFSLATVFDPSSRQQVTILSQFYYLFAILFFITLGGLEMMIGGIIRSFELVPLGGGPHLNLLSSQIVLAVGRMMIVGVQIAAPVVAAGIITNITLGFLVRAFPQANIFAVGLPIQLIVGLVSILLTLPAFLYFFSDRMNETLNWMNLLIQGLR
jgi:flagellar biosynthetic protein FliR